MPCRPPLKTKGIRGSASIDLGALPMTEHTREEAGTGRLELFAPLVLVCHHWQMVDGFLFDRLVNVAWYEHLITDHRWAVSVVTVNVDAGR